jgi:hypothetical protein
MTRPKFEKYNRPHRLTIEMDGKMRLAFKAKCMAEGKTMAEKLHKWIESYLTNKTVKSILE